MRVKRDYGPLESYHYYPEIKFCPHCETELVRSHPVWSKTIISLNETAKITNWGYCCPLDSCLPTIYRSAEADGLALKGYNFALDVIVFIGQERFNQHRNLTEIHASIGELGVQISSRRVSDFFMTYELLLGATQVDKLRAQREEIIQAGGVRLAIDGIQPQAGKEIVYIFRDVISGSRFGAVSLMHHDHKTLAKEMKKIKELLDSLDLPLRSIMTDHQDGLIKGIAEVWPNVPHQFCQLHFLKVLAKPIMRQDSALAKKLKKQLRPIQEIERALNNFDTDSPQTLPEDSEDVVEELPSAESSLDMQNECQDSEDVVEELPSAESSLDTQNECQDSEDVVEQLPSVESSLDTQNRHQDSVDAVGQLPSSSHECLPANELMGNVRLNDRDAEQRDLLPTGGLSVRDELIDKEPLPVTSESQTENMMANENDLLSAASELSTLTSQPSTNCLSSFDTPDEQHGSVVVSQSPKACPFYARDSLPTTRPQELGPHCNAPNQLLYLDGYGPIIEPLSGLLTDPLLLAEPTHSQFCHLERQLPIPNWTTQASCDSPLQAETMPNMQNNASKEALPVENSVADSPLQTEAMPNMQNNASKEALPVENSVADSPLQTETMPNMQNNASKEALPAENSVADSPLQTETMPNMQNNASSEVLPRENPVADSVSQFDSAKRQVFLGYCDAIRTLIQLKSLAPFKLAGVEIYEKMVQLSDSIIRCLSIQHNPTLVEIHSLLTPVYEFSEEYLIITRRQQYLLTFAQLLDVPKTKAGDWCQTGAEVATQFEELLSNLPIIAELHPEDSQLLIFFEKRCLDWMEGLFYCYEERDSPRTNNSLEQYNHFLKSQRRRVTGQKNVADYLIRHGPLIIFHDPNESSEEILSRFRQVSFEVFKKEYNRFQLANRRSRNSCSYRRNPKKFLTKLEELYIEACA